MQKIRPSYILYCLKIINNLFFLNQENHNCGIILRVRKVIFSVKFYMSLGYIYMISLTGILKGEKILREKRTTSDA